MAWDDGLAGTARNIAATNNSPLRVMAGPGTGKSFAMKRRVARLLGEGIPPNRILAVTFTRNAAASLVHDLRALGVANCDRVRAGTLHAYCFSLLFGQDVFEYLGRVPRPLVTFKKSGVLQFEAKPLLDDLGIAGAFGPKRLCTKRIRAFEAAWARLQSQVPGWPTDPLDRDFQQALIGWLKFHNAILIGELVPEALRFLRNNPHCAALTAFDHVIVDEYQDLNRAEQDLIQLLSSNGALAIVGDVDQSIFRFRHANPEGIRDFAANYPGTHDETLNECMRCPTRVVAIADHLIRSNHPGNAAPRLLPMPGNIAGEIHTVQWDNLDEEVHGLSEFIRVLIVDRGYVPGDILVLTPRRLLGYAIRDRIEELGISVHSFYHEEALEEQTAQRAYAILSLFVSPEDRVALRWWLGDGSPSNRKNAYQRLRQHCEQTGASLRAILEELEQKRLNLPNVAELIKRYRELKVELAKLEGRSVAEIIDILMPADNDECDVIREAALLALPTLEDAGELHESIKSHVTQPETPEKGDFVRVMSLHKSKGLTSKVAIIVGLSQSLIPYVDQNQTPVEQAAILQEQRRLFYVALTRCTEVLVLSSVKQMPRDFAWKIRARLVYGTGVTGKTIASQFLDELGPNAPPSQQGQRWVEASFSEPQ